MSENNLRVVFITAPSAVVARKIAATLVRERLAACVNVVSSVVSYYIWKGRFCRDSELLLIVKTTKNRLPAMFSRIKKLHPAEVPEIISIPVKEGLNSYLRWVKETVMSNEY